MATCLAVRAEAAAGISRVMKGEFVYDGATAISGNPFRGFYNEFILRDLLEPAI